MSPPLVGDNSMWCGRSFNPDNAQGAIKADVESVCSKFLTRYYTVIMSYYISIKSNIQLTTFYFPVLALFLILLPIISATSVPFKVRVNFDENEFRSNANPATIDSNAQDGEFLVQPGGIIGMTILRMNAYTMLITLKLWYLQNKCNIIQSFLGFSLCYTTE